MKKENLDNGIKPDVSGNEALREAVAFADWLNEQEWNTDCEVVGTWKKAIDDEDEEDFIYKKTEELYDEFLSAKATDR